MRIAHFVLGRSNPDSANGVDKTVYFLSTTQAKLGHKVAIFSITHLPPLPVPGVSVRAHRPIRLPLPLRAARSRHRRPRVPLPPSALMSDIERWSPDIMHFHSVHIPEAILIARRLARRNVPYCVAPHGGLIGGGGRQRLTSRALATALERRYLDRAAFLHAVSRADLQGARRYATRVPIVLAPNGIDPEVMPVELDSDLLRRRYRKFRGLRVLLYVGRLDPEVKGLNLLLQAWSRTGAASGMGLVIVGPDWRGGSRRLRLMAERLHLSGSVAFHGQTSGREKWDLLAGADIFVLPSRREAAPVTVLEAMLAAKPLLLSEAADPGKLIAQAGAGLVVQPTLESMKKGLKAVSELSDERLTDMGVNARRLVNREFGWARPTKMLLDAYEDAISSRTERTEP